MRQGSTTKSDRLRRAARPLALAVLLAPSYPACATSGSQPGEAVEERQSSGSHRPASGHDAAAITASEAAREKTPALVTMDIEALRKEIRRPGAQAVLVNVWATFCHPCREEMPALVRFFRDSRQSGLRFLLVSTDDESQRSEARRFLASQDVDFQTYLKTGNDMAFIDGLDPRWQGALPASFLFDGRGRIVKFWPRPVTYEDLSSSFNAFVKNNQNSNQKPTGDK